MNLNLNIYELGKALEKIEDKYKLNLLIKSKLSGGWITIIGEAIIVKIPKENCSSCSSKKDNIIDIKVKSDNEDGIIVKITGSKEKRFNVDISSSRYKEVLTNNLTINQIKVNENECKFRIDENIIFKINDSAKNIIELIES